MKIRNGFVSNSSSSSFVILMNKEELKEPYKIYNRMLRDDIVFNSCGEPIDVRDVFDFFMNIVNRSRKNIDNKHNICGEIPSYVYDMDDDKNEVVIVEIGDDTRIGRFLEHSHFLHSHFDVIERISNH